uniref:Uncharacterized protein n=1 Tax=Rhizophora mucronata TaxID=61149 RepID=A0A2P2PZN7_RHIMU
MIGGSQWANGRGSIRKG